MEDSIQRNIYLNRIKEEENLPGNKVFRQEFESLVPRFTYSCTVTFLLILALILLAVGLPNIFVYSKLKHIEVDYSDCQTGRVCHKTLFLENELVDPVFVYYKIEEFYINHRDYVMSRNHYQLHAEEQSLSKLDDSCEDALYIHETFKGDSKKYKTFAGHPLKANDISNPCGLVARAYFQDTFKLYEVEAPRRDNQPPSSVRTRIAINETDIADEYDLKHNFKNGENAEFTQWVDYTDEHFLVWMEMGNFPTFKKLWGRVEKKMPKGYYKLEIDNKFDVNEFEGKKMVVLETSSIAGTNRTFSIILISTAGILLIMVIALTVFHNRKPQRGSGREIPS